MTAIATVPLTDDNTASPRRSAAHKTGWILTTLITLFLGFDAVTHLLRESHVVQANAEMGAPAWFPVVCGAVLGTLLIGYHIDATRAMATVLITAYLGGAAAANLITERPAFNVVFAVLTAVMVWAGAWPRDARLRALVQR